MAATQFSGAVYKLHQGDDPLGLMGVMLNDASPTLNRGKMSCRVRISRESPDRSRDVVVAKGGILTDHRKNPLVTVAHNRNVVCGMAEDPLANYTVKMAADGLGLDAETFFSQSTAVGEQTFRLVESKVFRGASIGFLPGAAVQKSHAGGNLYGNWTLVEYAHLPLPDHPDCLVTAVEKGFGGKPLCPELDALLRPLCPTRPEIVTGGWDADEVSRLALVIKAGSYKTAEPKTVEPLTRSSTYYVCPHCGDEMSPEGIYKDEDGKTRHGACRGEVTMKPPGPSVDYQTVGTYPATKSYRQQLESRFLPLVSKAMPNEYASDPNAAGGAAGASAIDAEGDDDFLPPDDDEESGMKSGAEAHHGVNDILMQAVQFIDDAQDTVDNETAKKTLAKVSKWIGKAIAALHAGHEDYLEEHPDQPPLPGSPEGGSDLNSDEEDGDDSLDLDDDEEGDEEESDEDELDDEGKSTGKKKKKKAKKGGKSFGDEEEKAIVAWRTKAINAYWESIKRHAAMGDGPILKELREKVAAIVKDTSLPREPRVKAKEIWKGLGTMLVAKGRLETTLASAVPSPTDAVTIGDMQFTEADLEAAALAWAAGSAQ